MNFDKPVSLNFSEVALIAGTRAMLGVGIGLLVADRMSPRRRTSIGKTLALVGALSTIPLALDVMAKLGAFSKQSGDTSGARSEGRSRQWAEQGTGIW